MTEQPDIAGRIVERARQLAADLRHCYRDPAANMEETAVAMRLRHINAIMAVANFLDDLDSALDVGQEAAKLATLAEALFDLDAGTTHPMLKEQTVSGSAPARADIWRVRANAAIGIEYLLASGMSQLRAGSLAAKEYPGLARLVGPGRNLKTSILNWRRSLTDRTAKNDAAIEVFHDAGLRILNSLPRDAPKTKLKATGLALLRAAERDAADMIFDERGGAG